MTQLPYDIDAPIWSESVVLSMNDGTTDVSVRLCRYPSAGVAWIWAHVDLDDRRFGYNFDLHRSSADLTNVEEPDAVYTALGVPCMLWRVGERSSPESAGVSAEMDFHADAHPPNGPGEHRIRIDARFYPGAMGGEPVPGRSEQRGEVDMRLWLPGGEHVALEGHGHWHEQHQSAPRFRDPFTYVDLRGDGLALVAIRSARGVRGVAQREGNQLPVTAVDVGPPGVERPLRVELADGTVVDGVARSQRTRSVNIYGLRRPSADVILDGTALAGTINDWDPSSP